MVGIENHIECKEISMEIIAFFCQKNKMDNMKFHITLKFSLNNILKNLRILIIIKKVKIHILNA